jgi:hypothetical protein
VEIYNYPTLALWGQFTGQNQTATIQVILFDSTNKPICEVGPFTLGAGTRRFTDSNGTWYLGPRYLIDGTGAAKAFAYVSSLSTGATVRLFLAPLSG